MVYEGKGIPLLSNADGQCPHWRKTKDGSQLSTEEDFAVFLFFPNEEPPNPKHQLFRGKEKKDVCTHTEGN